MLLNSSSVVWTENVSCIFNNNNNNNNNNKYIVKHPFSNSPGVVSMGPKLCFRCSVLDMLRAGREFHFLGFDQANKLFILCFIIYSLFSRIWTVHDMMSLFHCI